MTISVVVPIYGVEAYIGQCARSLLSQSWKDTEFVFVNDGTPDRSMEVLQSVLEEFPGRDVKIVNKENGGLPQARKSGVEASSGDYIMHVDSDDWIEPGAIEKLARKAIETDADVIHYYVRKVKADGSSHISRDKDYGDPHLYQAQMLRFLSHGFMCNKLMKRRLYASELFWPRHNMHEDMVLSGQLLARAKTLVLIPEPLYLYRRDNPDSASRVRTSVRRGQSARNFLDLYEYWKGREDSPLKGFEPDFILRSTWVAFTEDKTIFTERPYLKAAAKAFPLQWDCALKLHRQLILKVLL